MPGDVVPTEAEDVAAGRINAALQQRGNGFRTGEAAGGVLVVAIGEIPKQVVAARHMGAAKRGRWRGYLSSLTKWRLPFPPSVTSDKCP